MGKIGKQLVVFFGIFLVIAVALVFLNKANDASRQANESNTSEAVQGNESPASTVASDNSPAASTSAVTDKTRAVIETNKGKIVFKFYSDKAPNTVQNFIKLANSSYYNGIKWHRVEPGFVIQGGDPLSKDDDPNNDGQGGPGYTINAEFNDMNHVEGTVAMARSDDPNSAGSQFYICLGAAPHLDGRYTVFGQVVAGMDVVKSIQIGDVMEKVYIENK